MYYKELFNLYFIFKIIELLINFTWHLQMKHLSSKTSQIIIEKNMFQYRVVKEIRKKGILWSEQNYKKHLLMRIIWEFKFQNISTALL